jgi:hypothetical protein
MTTKSVKKNKNNNNNNNNNKKQEQEKKEKAESELYPNLEQLGLRCTQSLSSLKPQRFAKFKFDFDSASLGSSGRFWTFPCYLFPSLGFG